MPRGAGANYVDLGLKGGEFLRGYLFDIASRKGVSLSDLVNYAYEKRGKSGNFYDTVKKWFTKTGCCRVRYDLLQIILEYTGCSVIDYPHLPENEKKRLTPLSTPSSSQIFSNLLHSYEIIDLSHEILSKPSCGFLSAANIPEFHITQGESHGITFNTTVVNTLPTNYGTHIDFPGHISTKKRHLPVSTYPLRQFVLESIVIDVREYALETEIFREIDAHNGCLPSNAFGVGINGIELLFNKVSELTITIDFFLRKYNGPLKNKAVLFCTGLDRYWQYSIQPSWRYAYFLNPFLSTDLAEYLVEQEVVLIGSDSLQLECPLFNMSTNDDFIGIPEIKELMNKFILEYAPRAIHEIFFDSSICIVENLRGLDKILPGPVLLVAAPLKLADNRCSDNSIVRAFAFTSKQNKRS